MCTHVTLSGCTLRVWLGGGPPAREVGPMGEFVWVVVAVAMMWVALGKPWGVGGSF